MSVLRSRKSFRFMSSPVLWHNVQRAVAGSAEATFGRGLYGKKVSGRPTASVTEPTETEPEALLGPRPRTMLRWQEPLSYLVIWQSRGWTLTWHAPWCRDCDCAGAGWRFSRDRGYLAGLGFELSSPAASDPPLD